MSDQDSSKEDAELKDGPLFALKRGSGIPLIRRKISFSSKRGMDFWYERRSGEVFKRTWWKTGVALPDIGGTIQTQSAGQPPLNLTWKRDVSHHQQFQKNSFCFGSGRLFFRVDYKISDVACDVLGLVSGAIYKAWPRNWTRDWPLFACVLWMTLRLNGGQLKWHRLPKTQQQKDAMSNTQSD